MKRIGVEVGDSFWVCSSITKPGYVFIQPMIWDSREWTRIPAKECRELAKALLHVVAWAELNALEAKLSGKEVQDERVQTQAD